MTNITRVGKRRNAYQLWSYN